MATYNVTPVQLSKDVDVVWGAGQATAANDVVNVRGVAATVDGSGVGTAVAKPLKGRYLALVLVGGGATATITVAAGEQGQTPANLADGQGTLSFTVGAAETRVVQLELAKYLKKGAAGAEDYVQLTVTGASATPTVRAIQLSKSA